MTPCDALVERFEQSREQLARVACRMLGSHNEADDALQEAWLRVSQSDASAVENPDGWLTTVVARVCLDMLRARGPRREDPLEAPGPDDSPAHEGTVETEPELLLADSLGPALLIVLETLGPAERVAFVLHDLFDLSFDEIAPIVGRSSGSARQLASRARRRVRGAAATAASDPGVQRQVVNAFLAASRDGDLDALLAVLDPDVRLRADATAVRTAATYKWGGAPELPRAVAGARAVAEAFRGPARGADAATLDGVPGAVWAMGGAVRAAWTFGCAGGKIVRIDLLMDPEHLGRIKIGR